MSTPTLISFSIYILAMVLIGVYFYFKTSNLNEYILGGRKLGPGVTALSAGASDMSGWLLLGLPGLIFDKGLVGIWLALGLIIGAYANWHYVAKRLRVYTHFLQDAITIPDFFSSRFEDNKNIIRIVTAVVILVFYTLYTASGLVGGAKLFQASFGLDYFFSLYLGSFIIISYTFLGGYNAVSWTDLIQGIFMMLALVIVPLVVLYDIGGLVKAVEVISDIQPAHLDLLSGASFISILSLMSWGLGYFGQPHILVRFMSIKNASSIPLAKKIGMTWMIVSVIGSVSVGFFGLAYVSAQGINVQDSEKIFISLTQLLFNPWISGFLLAAILAAIMSTIDSQLLVSSSVLTQDIYHAVLRKNASKTELLWVARATLIIISIIALYLAQDENASVLKLVSYAWAGFGAAFGPLIILSLYNPNITKWGALAGIVTGAVTVVVWKNLALVFESLQGGIFELYEIVPGFILSLLAISLISKLTKDDNSKMDVHFQEVQNIINQDQQEESIFIDKRKPYKEH